MGTHRTQLQIRFRDTDRLGHVNNAVYLSYFEQGRIELFNELLGLEINWNEQGLILANAHVDFLQPVHLEDKIVVELSVVRLGTKSFEIGYRIVRLGEPETDMARGSTVLVCFDYVENHSIAIPGPWREALEAFMAS